MGIFDLFSTAPAQNAAAAQAAGYNAGYGQLSDLANQQRGALQTNYTAGLQPFLQNFSGSQQGTNALGNALGLNGPQGNAAAVAAFQNNPGYQFQLQQGMDAVDANAAKTGQLASGNTNLDLLKFGQGLAGTGWNQYVSNLQPYLGASQAAATGIGNMQSNLGNQLGASYGNQGQAAYGAQTGIGNANANADLAAYNASSNALGAIAGGLGLGANLFGKFA